MKCKLSEKCEFGNLCKDATRHDSLTVLGCSSFKTKEPMTNEQWLHTATTEQLAEAILQQWIHGAYHGVGEFGLTDKEIELSREDIVEWLKQPHTFK